MSLAVLADAVAIAWARDPRTLKEIKDAGGPSPNVLSRLIHYDPRRHEPWVVRKSTLTALDTAFGWGENHAADLLHSEDPEGVVVVDVDAFATLVAQRVLTDLYAAARRLGECALPSAANDA